MKVPLVVTKIPAHTCPFWGLPIFFFLLKAYAG